MLYFCADIDCYFPTKETLHIIHTMQTAISSISMFWLVLMLSEAGLSLSKSSKNLVERHSTIMPGISASFDGHVTQFGAYSSSSAETAVSSAEYNVNSWKSKRSATEDHQVRLIRDLLDNVHFDPRARPVKNDESRPVNVTIRLSLYQLIQVDEPRESVVLNVWMTQTWQDEYLAWDPREYGNISWVVVPVQSVWRPDTTLYNGLDMQTENSERWICIELSMDHKDPHRAHVRFAFPALYRFSCSMDVLYFPFDKQNCTLLFGSWVYDALYIDFYPESEDVNLEAFILNEEWELVSFKGYRHVNKYTCCPNPYTVVAYHFAIKRKPLYFICNLVIPIVIITLISFVGFFTPSSTGCDRGEKVSLGITTLLAMSILLLMVADQMPTTSTFVPLMGWFFLTIIILISLASVLTALIINIQRGGRYGRRISKCTRKLFFGIVPKLICMKIPRHLAASSDDDFHITVDDKDNETRETLLLHRDIAENGKSSMLHSSLVPNSNTSPRHFRSESVRSVLRSSHNPTLSEKVDAVKRQIGRLQQVLVEKDIQREFPDEWEILANVVERLCLYIFTFLLTGFTSAILLIGYLAEQTTNYF